jgi:aminomethyltransferase
VVYTPWCDEHGKVVDDGTVHRLDDDSYRWTAAEPQLRWLTLNARGLDVEIEDVSEQTAAIALQGPLSRAVLERVTNESWTDLGYFRRRKSKVGRTPFDVSRTGYTGDLGYELWVDADQAVGLWDRLVEVGRAYGIKPAGMLALDMVRIEAGLILLDVDYTSSRHALIPAQNYSPAELNLGRLVSLDKAAEFVGKLALRAEQAQGGPTRRLVGLSLDWDEMERLYAAQDLSVSVAGTASRAHVPVYEGGRQIGRVTSSTWSPLLKKHIALASLAADYERPRTRVHVEWTVEARRGRVTGLVEPLPFFDPPRKKE